MATGAIAVGFVLSAVSTAVHGQAIIGDGNIILGVSRTGHLNVPYERVERLGLPSADPAGVGIVGLRSPDGLTTAVEKGLCVCEGWGAGIRDGGTFLDECGTKFGFDTNVAVTKFVSTDDFADSTVICGDQDLLKVRHRFRRAFPKDDECRGAYRVKVNIENRACRPVRDVIYRRSMDWDIDPSPFNEFVTIQNTNAPFIDDASNNGFCPMPPSFPCSPIDNAALPIDMFGPTDQGAHFDLDLGELDREEGVVFHMFYGKFASERDAQRCIEKAKIGPYSFAQDDEKRNLFMFGIRRNPRKYRFESRRCVDWDGRGPSRGRSYRESMDEDSDFAAEAAADGFMSAEEMEAANAE